MKKDEVKCPVCRHKLMLAYENAKGDVEHKCKICKSVIKINLDTRHTEPIGA